jgi:phosphoserine phosphatase RsbU/P
MKILIAEDDPIATKVLRLTLQKLGHEVIAASNGAEAWEMFHREPVRVVISDWMMPEMDGLQLCRRVRDRPMTLYTYFIILTAAHTSADDYTLAMDSGVDDFLTKPLDRELMRTRLFVANRILRYTKEIGVLQELIPICAYCSKVRDGEDYWQRVETYIRERTGSRFSHGVCPQCYDQQVKLLETEMVECGFGKSGVDAASQPAMAPEA